MHFMQWFRLNKEIIRVYNSCDRYDFRKIVNEVITRPNWETVFSSKKYIWNIIRPRDFYKMMSWFVVDTLTGQDYSTADKLIKVLLKTTQSETIRKSFIWNITKNYPILTADMLQYVSAEKVKNLLLGDNLVTDDAMCAVLNVVKELREKNKQQQEEIQVYQSLNDDIN